MARGILFAMALAAAGCGGDDDDNPFCVPQGSVSVGAIGTVGPPLQDFADCFGGQTPVVSLDQARTATATENTLDFDDDGLTASFNADTCRIVVTYTFDSELGDGTPTVGTATFAASPDPDRAKGTFSVDPSASIRFDWMEMGNDVACGNQVADAVIAVE